MASDFSKQKLRGFVTIPSRQIIWVKWLLGFSRSLSLNMLETAVRDFLEKPAGSLAYTSDLSPHQYPEVVSLPRLSV